MWPSSAFAPTSGTPCRAVLGTGLLPAPAAPVRFHVPFTPEPLSHYLDSIIVNHSLYQTFPVQMTVWLLSLNWTLPDTYVQTEILEESIKEDKEY